MFREELLGKVSALIKEGVDYTVTMLGDSGIIVEGHSGIRKYSNTEIVLRIRKKYIFIYGTDLTIKEINDVDIFVTGKIEKVSNVEEGK